MNDQAIQTKNVLIIHQNFPGQFTDVLAFAINQNGQIF